MRCRVGCRVRCRVGCRVGCRVMLVVCRYVPLIHRQSFGDVRIGIQAHSE